VTATRASAPEGASGRAARRAVALAALWSALMLLLAAGAASIPGRAPSPWSAADVAHAPPLARFDAGGYRTIALQGYGGPESARFYPLYPALVGGLSRFAQVPVFEAATVLSVLFLLGAALAAAKLYATGPAGGVEAVAALLFFPTSFFLAAPTSDSLFLCGVSAALLAARRGRWGLAAVAGAAAALTRAPGFLLSLAFLAQGRSSGDAPGLARPRNGAAAVVLLAGAAFPLFVGSRFGDPLMAWRGPDGTGGAFWRLPLDLVRETLGRLREPGAGGKLIFVLATGSLVLFALLTTLALRLGDRAGALSPARSSCSSWVEAPFTGCTARSSAWSHASRRSPPCGRARRSSRPATRCSGSGAGCS